VLPKRWGSNCGSGRIWAPPLLFILACGTDAESGPSTQQAEEEIPISGDLVAESAQPPVNIGVVDGDENLVFGSIRDVAVSGAGDVFVLDRLNMDVRWFDPTGRLMGRAGGKGQGPGEFFEPSALYVEADSAVVVLDPPRGRLTRYHLTNDGLELGEVKSLGRWADEFCDLDSGYLVYGIDLTNDAFLHRLGPGFEPILSFGDLVRETPPEVVAATGRDASAIHNKGTLLCRSNPETYFVLHAGIPWLRAFNPRGEEIWRLALSGLHGMHRWVVQGSVVRKGPLPDFGVVDSGRALFPWGPDTLAVSTSRLDYKTYEWTYEVRLVRMEDGAELDRFSAPMIVTGMDQEAFVGYRNYPFPQVVIARRP